MNEANTKKVTGLGNYDEIHDYMNAHIDNHPYITNKDDLIEFIRTYVGESAIIDISVKTAILGTQIKRAKILYESS